MDAKAKAIAALEAAGYHFHRTLKVHVGAEGSPIVGVADKYFEVTGPLEDLPALLSPLTIERVEAAAREVVELHGKPQWYDSNEDFVNDILARLKEVPRG
jgi:hypothetical protein